MVGVEDGQVGRLEAGEGEMWTPYLYLRSVGRGEEVKRQLGMEPTYG